MKLPFVVRDKTVQGNFDKLAGSVRVPVLATTFGGNWGTIDWTGPGGGVAFTPTTGQATIVCWATGFNTVAPGGVSIDVQVDGVLRATMLLHDTTATGERLTLPPAAFTVTVSAGVAHYVWFKQTLGTSDINDRGGVVVFA